MECDICFSTDSYNYCVVCNSRICLNCVTSIYERYKNKCHVCNKMVLNYNRVEPLNQINGVVDCNYRDVCGFFVKKPLKNPEIVIGDLIIKDIFNASKINYGYLYTNDTNFPFYYYNKFRILGVSEAKIIYNKFEYHKFENVRPSMLKLKNRLFLLQKNQIGLLKKNFIFKRTLKRYNYQLLENKYSATMC